MRCSLKRCANRKPPSSKPPGVPAAADADCAPRHPVRRRPARARPSSPGFSRKATGGRAQDVPPWPLSRPGRAERDSITCVARSRSRSHRQSPEVPVSRRRPRSQPPKPSAATLATKHHVVVRTHLLALLRRHGRRLRGRLQRAGRGLRHRQVRHGDRRHVRHEARAHHEVHHPRRHGGYRRHLRAGRRRTHCQRPQVRRGWLHPVQGLHPPGCGAGRRAGRIGRRLRHRHRRRLGRARHGPAAPPLRRHDPHPHLRRGLGLVRPHHRRLPVRQIGL